MTDLRQAAQQALEALNSIDVGYRSPNGNPLEVSFDEEKCDAAITALRAALAQHPEPTVPSDRADSHQPPGCEHCNHPLYAATKCRVCGRVTEQAEPVAYLWVDPETQDYVVDRCDQPPSELIPVYTAPPQRKPLTDKEIVDAVRESDLDWQAGWTLDEHEPNRFTTLARAVERAHGIGEEK